MPVKDLRTVMLTRIKGRMATSGRYHVQFRDAKGKTITSTVLGPGTVSGLKLTVGNNTRIVDNVPAMVNANDVNCYIWRSQ